jgi:hypothetical protein
MDLNGVEWAVKGPDAQACWSAAAVWPLRLVFWETSPAGYRDAVWRVKST